MSMTAAATAAEPHENRFRVAWPTYRKVIDNNCLFHREVYERLHRLLADEAPRPFRFLDVACGDASARSVHSREPRYRTITGSTFRGPRSISLSVPWLCFRAGCGSSSAIS